MKWPNLSKKVAKALGMGAAGQSAEQTFPVELEVIARELSVQIYLHDVHAAEGPISCWSYVTAGLAEWKQRELIFTLKRQENERPEDYSLEPISLFRTICGLAKEGRIVNAGDVTTFGNTKCLGFDGFTYAEPVWLPVDDAPAQKWLTMIALRVDEVDAILAFGAMRVTNILGRAESCFPIPHWNDRGRGARFSFQAMQDSILYQVPPAKGAGVRVFRQNGRIVLLMTSGPAEQIGELFENQAENSASVFGAEMDPEADGALVWLPGQDGPQAIAPPDSKGQRVCGTFVMFVPEYAGD